MFLISLPSLISHLHSHLQFLAILDVEILAKTNDPAHESIDNIRSTSILTTYMITFEGHCNTKGEGTPLSIFFRII